MIGYSEELEEEELEEYSQEDFSDKESYEFDHQEEEEEPIYNEDSQEEYYTEEKYEMSKIEEANEETYEESMDCSKMDSPVRKQNLRLNTILDSQVFDLKLSKIPKIGDEHRIIESSQLNFASNETGSTISFFEEL